jgi:type IV pilus assembly protein PilN
LTFEKGRVSDRYAVVQTEVAQLEAKEKERDEARKQVKAAQEQIQALTSVFSNIKPWSAMSQDLRDRLPAGVQITEILQKTEVPKAAASATPASPSPAAGQATPAPAAPPIGTVQISGYADDFDKVNDFLVVLQKSSFLEKDKTSIVKAERGNSVKLTPAQLPQPDGSRATSSVRSDKLPELPPKVEFQIQTELAQVSTDELLRELDRKGAVGLVSRIETLKEKGVIKP